jgi:hypothetical protein
VRVSSKNGCEGTVFMLRIFGQANRQISSSCWQFVNFDIPDIDLLLSPHLMSLFRSFVTGSDKSDWDFGLAIRLSPLLLLRRSTGSRFTLCRLLREVECFHTLCKILSFCLVTYFYAPNSFWVLLKISLFFFCFLRCFIFITGISGVLETKYPLCIKNGFRFRCSWR